MLRMFKYCLIAFVLVTSLHCFGQSNGQWGIEGRFKGGFLLGHRPVMGHLVKNHSYAGEVTVLQRLNGKKKWHSAYKYPEVGFTFYFGTAGNKEVLGNYFGGYSFLSIPFVSKKSFRLNGKLAAGIGVGTKQYDPISNPKNVAMSTPINAMICFALDGRYYFKKNWVSVGIDMTHFSNGAFKVPNLGLNLPYLSVGYGHYINKADSIIEQDEVKTPQRKILFGATAIISAKEVFPTGGKKYPVYGLSVHARTFLKPKVGWELAFDFISKQAILDYRPEIEKTQADIFQLGIYGGYLLPLDRFHFVLGMGYYVRDKYQPEDAMYHRVGFRYYLKNGISLNVVLKSHWARADYVEWGIGYCFNWKK